MVRHAGRFLALQADIVLGPASMVVLLAGCSESTAKPNVRSQEAPLSSAAPPVVAALASAPATAATAETIEDMRGKRPVDPAHQRCTSDGDCDAVLADCSNMRCVGVRKEFARSYAGLECKGYRGSAGNYDCQPSFHIEEPRCEAGKCLSRRIKQWPRENSWGGTVCTRAPRCCRSATRGTLCRSRRATGVGPLGRATGGARNSHGPYARPRNEESNYKRPNS